MEPTITLYAFPVSHFAEKIRWLFDHSRIPYREVSWVPILHAPAAYLKSGKRTVPFIEVSSASTRFVVHDSTKIIEWVNDHFEGVPLLPAEESQHRLAMELEDLADSIGRDVIRYMYAPMIEQPDDFIEVWGWGAKRSHKRMLRLAFPLVRALLSGNLDFSTQAREAGLQRLHGVFRQLDERLADGRRFLVGDRLSIADTSAASLLAPVIEPDSHAVYASEPFRRTLVEQQSAFVDHASFSWLRDLYARHRETRAETASIYSA